MADDTIDSEVSHDSQFVSIKGTDEEASDIHKQVFMKN